MEIGIRKVVGADRKQLILQFIGETVLLSLFAMILATIITLFIIPSLNDFTGKSISFNPFTNPLLGLLILSAGIIIGILAGVYPALVLSGFQPIKVLKSMKLVRTGNSTAWFAANFSGCAICFIRIANCFYHYCIQTNSVFKR
jgi:putative ABC transport system permease protein